MAQLYVGLLSEAHSELDILEALDTLPKEIDATYDEILNRINSQRAKDAKLAKKVLGWITYAKQPLTIKELQQGLSITPDSTKPDERAEVHERILISACLGLVTIDSKSSIIRLVHYTTQGYIERLRERQFPEEQARIAKACLTCLGFDMFIQSSQISEQMLDNYIFVHYASRLWAKHVNDLGENLDVQEAVLRVLTNKRKRDAIYLLEKSEESKRWLREDETVPWDGNFLHAIAFYGLVTTCQIVLFGTHNIPQL